MWRGFPFQQTFAETFGPAIDGYQDALLVAVDSIAPL
jgi:hypothetical protein